MFAILESAEYEKKLDKLINRFIHYSRGFVETSTVAEGLTHLLIHREETNKLTYDHEYLNFTKSTKTLISIRNLLKENHNEDVLVLVRTIFENYLSTRYLNENEKFIEQIIKLPSLVFSVEYNFDEARNVVNRNQEIMGKLLNPATFKIGKDKSYYTYFYAYLSAFSHSNFGVASNYLDEHLNYTIKANNDPLLVRFFVVFVFTKLFEHVVTTDGEDFYSPKFEQKCYELVEESLRLQNEVIPVLNSLYAKRDKDDYFYNRILSMLKRMKISLKEELGSSKINRDFL